MQLEVAMRCKRLKDFHIFLSLCWSRGACRKKAISSLVAEGLWGELSLNNQLINWTLINDF